MNELTKAIFDLLNTIGIREKKKEYFNLFEFWKDIVVFRELTVIFF